jgi:hypothetical protein
MADTPSPAPSAPPIDAAKQYNVQMLETLAVGPATLIKGRAAIILGSALKQLLASNPSAIGKYSEV